jgi:hypothetical protein
MGLGLFCLLALALIPGSLACKEVYLPSEDVIIEDVIEYLGDGADCNISLYSNNTQLQDKQMLRFGLAYTYTFGQLPEGVYMSNIECNLSNSTFLGQCNFIVEGDRMSGWVLGIGVVLLGVIGLLFFLAEKFDLFFFTDTLGRQYPIMRYLLYLIGGWFIFAIVAVVNRMAEIDNLEITGMLTTFMKAIMWVMLFVTIIWFVGFIYQVLNKVAEQANE